MAYVVLLNEQSKVELAAILFRSARIMGENDIFSF